MDDAKRPDETASVNFREVCMGDIAPNWLYRSSHPITCNDEGFIIVKLAETAKIAAVLNLADNEMALKRKSVFVPWYNKLFQEGRAIALNMSFDFRTDKFGGKINEGIKFIINHQGPYLIHCLQGIDRTGFFVMLLEMAMGASKDEIIGDYMASFLDRPGYEKESAHYKHEHGNFMNVLRELNGGKPVTTKSMPGMAEKYIFETAGLTQSELEQLKLALSKRQEQLNAAPPA